MRKGIVLAGGSGTRLYPITKTTCKQLLPVYDKPMIYYPIATLMLAGIKEIAIISTPNDIQSFKNHFSDGSELGIHIEYIVQKKPNGIAESLILAEKFIKGEKIALILGDNIYYGDSFSSKLQGISSNDNNVVFAYHVKDPTRYGVVEFNDNGDALSIIEKPQKPKSNYAVTGLYFFQNNAITIAKSLTPSARGELEISDVNSTLLKQNKLKVEVINRGTAWLDAGTHASLAEASNYIKALEDRQGLKIAILEEISWRMGYITKEQLINIANNSKSLDHKNYLINIVRAQH